MGYRKISNLYKNQTVLMFKEVNVSEKIHGTSAHIKMKKTPDLNAFEAEVYKYEISFFSGGASHDLFLSLFNEAKLLEKFKETGCSEVILYGEAYGGCLSWCTPILLSDGTTKEIGDIVNHKLNLEVLSYNIQEQRLENKKIIGWSRQSNLNNWNTVYVDKRLRGGKSTRLVMTDNHVIYVKNKNHISEVTCAKLKVGDVVLLPSLKLVDIQEDIVRGGLLGDSSISKQNTYRFTHSTKQQDYFNFKSTILNSIKQSIAPRISGYGADCIHFNSVALPELRNIKNESHKKNKKIITKKYLDKLNPLALAIWYMDDGTLRINNNGSHRNQCQLCTDGFEEREVELIVKWFNNKGIESYKMKHKKYYRVHFSPNGTEKLHFIIAPYIHKSMKYKLNDRFKGVPFAIDMDAIPEITSGLIETRVNRIIKGNPYKQPCYNERFDIEIEDNHNFFANKVLVHNSMQGMRDTYGDKLKFIVFEAKVGGVWLNMERAEYMAKQFEQEFIWYTKCKAEVDILDAYRDQPSVQAKRNGILEDKKAEGIVIRPVMELTTNNGGRVLAKHKRADFSETRTKRKVQDPAMLKILEDAKEIAEEWVTLMRLTHVLDKLKAEGMDITTMKSVPLIIKAMQEDIKIEGEGEIVYNKSTANAIARNTAKLFKQRLNDKIEEK